MGAASITEAPGGRQSAFRASPALAPERLRLSWTLMNRVYFGDNLSVLQTQIGRAHV